MIGFGDIRVAQGADWFLQQIVATGSLVVRRVGGNRAGEVSAHRLLSSPHVSVDAVIDTLSVRTAEACAGQDIVCAQDTSEINFAGRSAARVGLGPGGDGVSEAFFVHPLVAISADTGAVLGLAGAKLRTRGPDRVSPKAGRSPADKESHRWLEMTQRAGEVLATARSITVVADRESDIYHLFANRPANVELIVRAAQNRAVDDGGLLFDVLAASQPVSTAAVKVAPRGPGDKGRVAKVELRSARLSIKRPDHSKAEALAGAIPQSIPMTVVEVREIDPPGQAKPLLWRLLSSADRSPEEIVRLYRQRWRIEEVFRTLKSGLGLPDTQMQAVKRILLLAAFALAAAVRIIQLVDARDGTTRPIEDAIDPVFKPAIMAISQKLEGATEKQKNPHAPTSLAFLSWICARLGGWNCYYKPPGPKTMATGWKILAQQLVGYSIAEQNINV